jgi:Na+/H+-dicarboxylate symporter
MQIDLLIIGIISLVIGIYIFLTKRKREELETYELDSRFQLNSKILSFGIVALFIGTFSLIAFFYRLMH